MLASAPPTVPLGGSGGGSFRQRRTPSIDRGAASSIGDTTTDKTVNININHTQSNNSNHANIDSRSTVGGGNGALLLSSTSAGAAAAAPPPPPRPAFLSATLSAPVVGLRSSLPQTARPLVPPTAGGSRIGGGGGGALPLPPSTGSSRSNSNRRPMTQQGLGGGVGGIPPSATVGLVAGGGGGQPLATPRRPASHQAAGRAHRSRSDVPPASSSASSSLAPLSHLVAGPPRENNFMVATPPPASYSGGGGGGGTNGVAAGGASSSSAVAGPERGADSSSALAGVLPPLQPGGGQSPIPLRMRANPLTGGGGSSSHPTTPIPTPTKASSLAKGSSRGKSKGGGELTTAAASGDARGKRAGSSAMGSGRGASKGRPVPVAASSAGGGNTSSALVTRSRGASMTPTPPPPSASQQQTQLSAAQRNAQALFTFNAAHLGTPDHHTAAEATLAGEPLNPNAALIGMATVGSSQHHQQQQSDNNQQFVYAREREAAIKGNRVGIVEGLVEAFNTSYYARRSAAAVCIQCAWRSARARLEAFSRRQIFWHFVFIQQKAAVTCIVSFMKGVLLRKRRLALRAINAQRIQEKVARERLQRAAVFRITNAIRRYIARKKETQRLMRLLRLRQEEKLSCYKTAAVIVQRWFRIIRVEKAYWRRRHAEVAEEKAKRLEAQRIDVAATRIQKIFRGGAGRRHAAEHKDTVKRERAAALRKVKESIDAVRVFLKSVAARKRRELATGERYIVSEDGATVTAVPIVQFAEDEKNRNSYHNNNTNDTNCGGADASPSPTMTNQLALRLMEQRERQRALDNEATLRMLREAQRLVYHRAMEAAKGAGVIQRAWRCFRARRELRVKRTIAKAHDGIRFDSELDQYLGVCLLQRAARAAISAMYVRKVHEYSTARCSGAVSLLQRVGRGMAAARRPIRLEQCMAIYTANKIVYDAERQYQRNISTIVAFVAAKGSLLRAAAQLRKKRAADEAMLREVRRLVEEDKAAAKIQRLVRANNQRAATRQQVEALNAAKSRVLAAVIKIQSFVRAKLFAKRIYLRRKKQSDFAKRNRALEVELAERELLQFLARFEEIELAERCEIAGREDHRWGALCGRFAASVAAGGRASVLMADGDDNSTDHDDDVANFCDPYSEV